MTDAEQIAAFLATRGVMRVATGEGALNHMTARDWRNAARNPKRIDASVNTETQRLIDERHTVIDATGRIRMRNGLGEWIA